MKKLLVLVVLLTVIVGCRPWPGQEATPVAPEATRPPEEAGPPPAQLGIAQIEVVPGSCDGLDAESAASVILNAAGGRVVRICDQQTLDAVYVWLEETK